LNVADTSEFFVKKEKEKKRRVRRSAEAE